MIYEPGYVLLEKYQLLQLLGKGGWGNVYKALDLKLGREVAIKHLKSDLTKDEVALERFLREAKTIAGLRHPNIVTIHALERDGDDHYIVMEYAERGTLEDLLKADGPLAIDQSVDIAIAICRALELVHSKEIIHRDIKPSNILLFADAQGNLTPKLADFGIAKTPPRRQERRLTGEGLVVGTFNYMSPEQLKGEAIDARSDVYGMGLVLYQMLTGDLPYVSNALDLLLTTRDIVPPTEKREDIPEVIEQVVIKALVVNSTKRIPTARAMAEALESFGGIKSSAYTWAELEALYKTGIGHLERGELHEAISKLGQLASIDTTFRDVQDKLKIAEEQLELEELYQQGVHNLENEEWRDAADCFGQIIIRQPDFKDAEQKWKEARQREGLQIQYKHGLRYFEQKRWENAAAIFRDIVSKAPDYLDAKDRLAHANRQIKLNTLYERASVGIQASRWQEVIQALEEIVELNATYRDAADLLEQARLERDLESSYQEGVEHSMRESWHAALASFERVQTLRPEYKDVTEFLRRASEQAKLEDLYQKGREYEAAEQWEKAREVYGQILATTNYQYKDADKRLTDVNVRIRVEIEFAKGQDAFEKEQWSVAIRLLKKALEQKPDHQKSMELLTEARVQQKLNTLYDQAIAHEAAEKWDQAVETWEQIIEIRPDYGNAAQQINRARQRQRIESLYEEGWKYLRDQNYEKALERFEQVLDLDPNHQGAITSKEEAKKLKLHGRDTEEKERWWRRQETEVKTAFIGLLGVVFSTLLGTLGAVFLSYWLNRPGVVPSSTLTSVTPTATPASTLTGTTSMSPTLSYTVTITTAASDLPDYLASSFGAVLNIPLIAALLGGLIAASAVLAFDRFLISAMMSIFIRVRRASRREITLTGTRLTRLRPLAFVLALILAMYLLIKIMSVLGKSIDYLGLLSHPAWQGVAALIALVTLVFQEDIRKFLEKPRRKRFIYLTFLSLLFLSAFIAADSSIPTPTPIPTPLPPATITVYAPATNTNTPTTSPTSTFVPTPTDTPRPPSPTATFTATPTPTPTPEAVVVAATGLNLRSGPGVAYDPPIDYLHNGAILDIKGRIASNEWIQVVPIADPDLLGWVSASPTYVQINVDLNIIPIVETPPPQQAPISATPILAPAPVLHKPPDGTSLGIQNRLDLEWTWDGTLGPNDYFRVEIWNEFNDFSVPIDVAWVQTFFYAYDVVDEAYRREYRWRITVVRGTPAREKDWSTPENQVWQPGQEFEHVSTESVIWTLFVEPGITPVPAEEPEHPTPCPRC